MDMTVTRIGAVVVAELRAAGCLESTIGQYEKTIKALRCFVEERGGTYTPALGAAGDQVVVVDGLHRPDHCSAPSACHPARCVDARPPAARCGGGGAAGAGVGL